MVLLQNVFRPIYYLWGFWGKNQKTLNFGKIRNYDEESVFFKKKNVFIFLTTFFLYKNEKWEGAKDDGGSRSSCWKFFSRSQRIVCLAPKFFLGTLSKNMQVV